MERIKTSIANDKTGSRKLPAVIETEEKFNKKLSILKRIFLFILKIIISAITKILVILLMAVFFYSSYKIARYYIEGDNNKRIQSEVQELANIKPKNAEDSAENISDQMINFAELKEKNMNTIAWLKVNNTDIDFPIVRTTDNEFYLDHNFYKAYNPAGWIFMDFENKLDGTDKNLVIYGHNRKDGAMFGTLKNVLNEDWYNVEENKQIEFTTEIEKAKYEVFSVYETETENYYRTLQFGEGEFENFIGTIKSRSIKDFGTEVTGTDSILTLSTCGNTKNKRIVLHAKKIVGQ